MIYEAVYTGQFACECGPGCKALYTCLLVNAFLNGTDDSIEDREWPIYVYHDDWQLVEVNTAEEKMREQVSGKWRPKVVKGLQLALTDFLCAIITDM